MTFVNTVMNQVYAIITRPNCQTLKILNLFCKIIFFKAKDFFLSVKILYTKIDVIYSTVYL
jgi:hypothetical protein